MSKESPRCTKSTEKLIESDVDKINSPKIAHKNDALESSDNDGNEPINSTVQVVVVDRVDIHQVNETPPIPASRKSLFVDETKEIRSKSRKRETKTQIEMIEKVPTVKPRKKIKEIEETILSIENERPVDDEKKSIKIKKKKKQKQLSPEAEDDVEKFTETNIERISIKIVKTSELRFEARLRKPHIEISIFNGKTEHILMRQSPNSSEDLERFSTQSGTLNESIECVWSNGSTYFIPENLKYLQTEQAIILFELIEPQENDEPGYPICWSFLSLNDQSEIIGLHRLQFYEYQRNRNKTSIYEQFRNSPKKYVYLYKNHAIRTYEN